MNNLPNLPSPSSLLDTFLSGDSDQPGLQITPINTYVHRRNCDDEGNEFIVYRNHLFSVKNKVVEGSEKSITLSSPYLDDVTTTLPFNKEFVPSSLKTVDVDAMELVTTSSLMLEHNGNTLFYPISQAPSYAYCPGSSSSLTCVFGCPSSPTSFHILSLLAESLKEHLATHHLKYLDTRSTPRGYALFKKNSSSITLSSILNYLSSFADERLHTVAIRDYNMKSPIWTDGQPGLEYLKLAEASRKKIKLEFLEKLGLGTENHKQKYDVSFSKERKRTKAAFEIISYKEVEKVRGFKVQVFHLNNKECDGGNFLAKLNWQDMGEEAKQCCYEFGLDEGIDSIKVYNTEVHEFKHNSENLKMLKGRWDTREGSGAREREKQSGLAYKPTYCKLNYAADKIYNIFFGTGMEEHVRKGRDGLYHERCELSRSIVGNAELAPEAIEKIALNFSNDEVFTAFLSKLGLARTCLDFTVSNA